MTKLNDLLSMLLSAAAQRESGSLLPVPEAVAGAGGRLTKALAALVKTGLAEERETSDTDGVHRTDGDLRYGLFITETGSTAIGLGEGDGGGGRRPGAGTGRPQGHQGHDRYRAAAAA